MNAFFSSFTGSALLFVFTLLSGVVLSHSGKPYPSLVFTIHKLVAVGTIFLILRNIYRLQQVAPIRAFMGPGALLVTGLFFAALVISGALLSLQDGNLLSLQTPVLNTVHLVHQVAPLLTVAAAGLGAGLLVAARS